MNDELHFTTTPNPGLKIWENNTAYCGQRIRQDTFEQFPSKRLKVTHDKDLVNCGHCRKKLNFISRRQA